MSPPLSVEENIRYLQRQINRLAAARSGPMSWGPGDGHVRFYDANGDTLFEADAGGASVQHGGSLTAMTPLLEGHTSAISSHGTRLSAAETKNSTQDSRLDGHDSTLTAHDARISTAQTRADSAHTLAAGKAELSYVTGLRDSLMAEDSALSGRVSTAQSRADAAFSSASTKAEAAWVTGIRDALMAQDSALSDRITTAQSRADSAWTRAGTGIADAANARDLAIQAANSVQALRSEVHQWMQQARANDPSLPPPIPN